MHYLSSNYPNATDLNNPGRDGDYKAGYFLSAADAASLDEIFENISGSIGSSSTTIGKEAVLTDYIADSFDLSKIDQGRDITVYTSDYRGGGNWSDKTRFDDVEVEVDQDNKTVSVTNFDYSGNFILDEDPETGAPKGQKIIVEITVPTIDGFVGGNQVPTNTSDAAIYEHDEVFKAFPEPDVDVPLKYDFVPHDASIYITDSWNNIQSFFDDTEKEGLQYKIDGKEFTIDGKRNGYADVVYTITDSAGNIVGEYTIPAGETEGSWTQSAAIHTESLTGDEKYTVSATVRPSIDKADGVKDLEVPDKNAVIHVFKPTVNTSDTAVFYGETTDLNDRIGSEVTWNCEDKNAPKPAGKEPELTYDFTVVNGTEVADGNVSAYMPEEDSDFKIVVKYGEKDITGHTTITNEDGRDEKHDFTVKVVKGQLTIQKRIDQAYTDIGVIHADQSFVFKIERRDRSDGPVVETFYEVISFDADADTREKSSATIKGLKKGFYTVTEETDWSVKYQLVNTENNYNGNDDAKNLYIGERQADGSYYGLEQREDYLKIAAGSGAEAKFTNNVKTGWKWLSDVAAAVNKFIS